MKERREAEGRGEGGEGGGAGARSRGGLKRGREKMREKGGEGGRWAKEGGCKMGERGERGRIEGVVLSTNKL
jgi:hypothetical protein